MEGRCGVGVGSGGWGVPLRFERRSGGEGGWWWLASRGRGVAQYGYSRGWDVPDEGVKPPGLVRQKRTTNVQRTVPWWGTVLRGCQQDEGEGRKNRQSLALSENQFLVQKLTHFFGHLPTFFWSFEIDPLHGGRV